MSLQLDPYLDEARATINARSLVAGPALPLAAQSRPGLMRRTWRAVAYPMGLVVGLMIFLAAWQNLAPDGWRVSQLIGHFTGDTKAAEIAASLAAEKAKTAALLEEQTRMQQQIILTQARAQEIVTAAQSQAQQEVAALQKRAEIATAAYTALFERANQMAVLYAQATQSFVQTRTEMARANQGGSTMVANFADIFKGLAVATGNHRMYQQADTVHRAATEGQMEALDAAMARAVPTLDARAFVAQGLPDPAALRAFLDFTPETQRPAPLAVSGPPPMPVRPYQPSAPGR